MKRVKRTVGTPEGKRPEFPEGKILHDAYLYIKI
jgi:hypothetical protein